MIAPVVEPVAEPARVEVGHPEGDREDPRQAYGMVDLSIMVEAAAGPPDPLAKTKRGSAKYSEVVDF